MILQGDVRGVLPLIPSASVQMCVTSPPYWALRDYGVADQIGLERTPAEFVDVMVRVFREVRRILKSDGTLWLNLGDSYAASGKNRTPEQTGLAIAGNVQPSKLVTGLKPKDLVGIPWSVAFALRGDGWFLRQEIIWHKPNPMPESVTDRCTKSHEHIFLLSKSSSYLYQVDAIREPCKYPPNSPQSIKSPYDQGFTRRAGFHNHKNDLVVGQRIDEKSNHPLGRNKRSVWTVTPKPLKEAHFATFPPDLIEPCILAGSRVGDTILDPFFGAGTTGLVAERHGRKWLGVEINPAYIEIATRRIVNARV